MIVQWRENGVRLIRQFDHSLAAGRLALEWTDIEGAALAPRLAFAIAWHDLVWAEADREARWDDARRAPVSFQTIATALRRPLYASGLDRLEQIDPYASLLASLHFSRFVEEPDGEAFRENELLRRERIADRFGIETDDPRLAEEAALLRHFDDLSLYVCLCGPESKNPPEWLPTDRVAACPDGRRRVPEWRHAEELAFRPFPFRRPIHLTIPCRDLPGPPYETAESLQAAWRAAKPAFHEVRVVPA